MKPWHDRDLLEMIVFAQQNPDSPLEPIKDRIQEMGYNSFDLYSDYLYEALIVIGYGMNISRSWATIGSQFGITKFLQNYPAIPFPDAITSTDR